MLKSTGGRAGVNFWFPVNNLSLFWLIDTKFCIWVTYIKRQLRNATQVSLVKVKVTVAVIATQVSGIFLFSTIDFLCWYKCNLSYDAALDCYRGLGNLGHCFGVKCLVVENLVFALHCSASRHYIHLKDDTLCLV